MSQLACTELINRQLYPIDDLENPKRASAIVAVRATLREDGCAIIRGFFSESGLAALRADAFARKAEAYYSDNKACNVYLGNGNPERPDDHPQNIFLERTNGFIRLATGIFEAITLSRTRSTAVSGCFPETLCGKSKPGNSSRQVQAEVLLCPYR